MARFAVIIGATALVLAACASKPDRPTEELTRARTLVSQAEQGGAQQTASAELQTARDKVQRADRAADDGNTEMARRLAIEAALDAELAAVKARSAQSQAAAAELDRSIETLRNEAARGAGQQQPAQ
jgi:hypothetical protein